MGALEEAYRELGEGKAINQLRYDVNMPLPQREERQARYEFKTVVGIVPKLGVAALRMSSTLNHRPIRNGIERAERLYLAPGESTVGLIIVGKVKGRTRDDEITMFRGHGLGLQFAAVGAKAYELAKKKGLGHEIPTEWFTQTLHT